ncbi:MAG TPA: ABC transporter substrate-binding protein, partial [Actinomycetota bacterium]|nr:ABC transporter substrate-binding protein [Actinomycetota bacterium]
RLSGGAAMAWFLAACGLSNSSSTSSPGASASPLPPVGGDLNLYTWEGYDLTKQFASWRQENNITQHLKFITQPEEVPTVLKGAGGDKWDLSYGDNVVLTDYKNLGLIRPMTTTEVPGLTGLMPAFQVDPWKNADGTYNAAPWTWGFSGLTYRTDRVPAPASWHDILDPKYKGRVSTVDGALNNVALGSLAVGIDPDTLTTAQLNAEVKDYLVQLRGQIRALAPSIGDQISLLVSGDVDYMVVGLTFMDAETAAKGVSTKTVVPSEGAIGWADSAFVPPTAPDPQNALAWINHVLDPTQNAKANNSFLQGPGVAASIPMLDKAVTDLYPFDDIDNYLTNVLTFNRGFPRDPDGDRATYDQVVQLWEEVKAS